MSYSMRSGLVAWMPRATNSAWRPRASSQRMKSSAAWPSTGGRDVAGGQLEHEADGPAFEPAPGDALREFPGGDKLESQAVAVEGKRALHVGDPDEGPDSLQGDGAVPVRGGAASCRRPRLASDYSPLDLGSVVPSPRWWRGMGKPSGTAIWRCGWRRARYAPGTSRDGGEPAAGHGDRRSSHER